MIRIAIADDHPLLVHGLQRMVEQQDDMLLVTHVGDGRRALAIADEHAIDVMIVDLSLPRVGGMEVVRRLTKRHPEIRLVVLSMQRADQYEARLLELGASAYVSKDAPASELLRVIRAVAAGRPVLERKPAPASGTEPRHKALSAREYQVFTLIFQGKTVAEIAAELDLTSSTVSNHLAKIREKLGVRTVGEIVRYALEVGLVGFSRPEH